MAASELLPISDLLTEEEMLALSLVYGPPYNKQVSFYYALHKLVGIEGYNERFVSSHKSELRQYELWYEQNLPD